MEAQTVITASATQTYVRPFMTPKEINPIPFHSWFAQRRNIVLLIAAFFLLMSAFTYFLCYRHYQQVKEHILPG